MRCGMRRARQVRRGAVRRPPVRGRYEQLAHLVLADVARSGSGRRKCCGECLEAGASTSSGRRTHLERAHISNSSASSQLPASAQARSMGVGRRTVPRHRYALDSGLGRQLPAWLAHGWGCATPNEGEPNLQLALNRTFKRALDELHESLSEFIAPTVLGLCVCVSCVRRGRGTRRARRHDRIGGVRGGMWPDPPSLGGVGVLDQSSADGRRSQMKLNLPMAP